MTREVICAFKGRLEVTEAKKRIVSDDSTLPQGLLIGKYRFDEVEPCREPGRLQGVFASHILIDRKTGIRYDSLDNAADGFWNNGFVGTWKKPGDAKAKVCN